MHDSQTHNILDRQTPLNLHSFSNMAISDLTNGDDSGFAKARETIITNRLQDCMAEDKLAHSFSLKMISNIEVVHYAAVAGYDAVLLDLEHSSFSLDTANQLSVAALQVG